jgi:hypothetical protein
MVEDKYPHTGMMNHQDQKTKRPKDQKTKRPKDHKTDSYFLGSLRDWLVAKGIPEIAVDSVVQKLNAQNYNSIEDMTGEKTAPTQKDLQDCGVSVKLAKLITSEPTKGIPSFIHSFIHPFIHLFIIPSFLPFFLPSFFPSFLHVSHF